MIESDNACFRGHCSGPQIPVEILLIIGQPQHSVSWLSSLSDRGKGEQIDFGGADNHAQSLDAERSQD